MFLQPAAFCLCLRLHLSMLAKKLNKCCTESAEEQQKKQKKRSSSRKLRVVTLVVLSEGFSRNTSGHEFIERNRIGDLINVSVMKLILPLELEASINA